MSPATLTDAECESLALALEPLGVTPEGAKERLRTLISTLHRIIGEREDAVKAAAHADLSEILIRCGDHVVRLNKSALRAGTWDEASRLLHKADGVALAQGYVRELRDRT